MVSAIGKVLVMYFYPRYHCLPGHRNDVLLQISTSTSLQSRESIILRVDSLTLKSQRRGTCASS